MTHETAKPTFTPTSSGTLAEFVAIVGQKYAISDANVAEQEPYLIEWRRLYRGKTPLILRPGSTEEVSRILALAHATGTAIVPQGGNTGLTGAQIPFGHEVVVSLSRMNRIRSRDARGNSMVV